MVAFFISFIVLWIVISALLLVLALTHDKREMRKFDSRVYKKVMRLADDNDYLLINSVSFTDRFDRSYKADYFLIADKFCYAINECQIGGVVEGKPNESMLNNITMKKEEKGIDNFFLENRRNALGFDSFINERVVIDCKYVIPVTVVPDSLSLGGGLTSSYKNSYVFKLKELKKGISIIEEKSDIKPISNSSINSIKRHILALVAKKEEGKNDTVEGD